MTSFSDLSLASDLVQKYKHVLPILRIPRTNSFYEDPKLNLMLSINLDEHRNFDRWVRRSNLQRKICFARCLARHKPGRPTDQLLGHLESNPEKEVYSYVSDDQLKSIIRGGLREGSGFVEGIDFVFPDLAARAEDEAREDQANRGEGGVRNLEGVPGVFSDLAYRAVDEARAESGSW